MSDNDTTGGSILSRDNVKYVLGGASVLFLVTLILFAVATVTIFFPDCFITRYTLSLLQFSGEQQSQQGSTPNARAFLVSTAGTLGSLAVSLALFGVYLSQNDIMQNQVETQTQQLKSMRQETMPFLGVHGDGVELHDTKPIVENPDTSPLEVSDGDDGCWISVGVENHGAQIAHQVHMACLVDFPDLEDEPPLSPGVCALESTKTVTDSPIGKGALVSSASGLMLLRGTPRLRENTAYGSEKTTFRDKIIMQLLDKERTVRFGFILIYTNSMEQDFKVTLTSWSAKPENFDSFDKTDVSATQLVERSTEYPTERLIEESGWEIPTDTFVAHEE